MCICCEGMNRFSLSRRRILGGMAAGLVATALNTLPVGRLDGGRATLAAFGGGVLGVTMDMFPTFGVGGDKGNIYHAAGYSGHGVMCSAGGARRAVDLLLQRIDALEHDRVDDRLLILERCGDLSEGADACIDDCSFGVGCSEALAEFVEFGAKVGEQALCLTSLLPEHCHSTKVPCGGVR